MTARRNMHEEYCRFLRCRYTDGRLDDPAVCEECFFLDRLLDRVEDDRAHAEAEKLREMAARMVFNLLDPFSPQKEGWVRHIADKIDPYEMRDGKLVRKTVKENT